MHNSAFPKRPGPLDDEEKVTTLLMSTRSVSLTAAILGTTTNKLSRWLRRAKRLAWWENAKAQWVRETHRAKRRRLRARHAAREGRVIRPRRRKCEPPVKPLGVQKAPEIGPLGSK